MSLTNARRPAKGTTQNAESSAATDPIVASHHRLLTLHPDHGLASRGRNSQNTAVAARAKKAGMM